MGGCWMLDRFRGSNDGLVLDSFVGVLQEMNNNREPEKINTTNNRSSKMNRPVERSRDSRHQSVHFQSTRGPPADTEPQLDVPTLRNWYPCETGNSEDLGWTRCRLEVFPLEGTGFYPDTAQRPLRDPECSKKVERFKRGSAFLQFVAQ